MKIGIVTDVHEDFVSLRKVLKRLDRKGYDRLVCLGDVSGFSVPPYRYERSRDASGCLSLLREREALIVAGNHDYFAARKNPPCSEYFCLPRNWYDLSYEVQMALTKGKLWLHETDMDTGYSAEEIEYLRSLPEWAVMDVGGVKAMFSHYVFPNHSGIEKGFYSWGKDFEEHFKKMEEEGCDVAFTGHAHIRGFYVVSKGQYREYGYRNLKLGKERLIFGLPPVTRHGGRRGGCLFDGERLHTAVCRC